MGTRTQVYAGASVIVFVLVMYDVIPTVDVSVTTGGAGVAMEKNVAATADGVAIVRVVGPTKEGVI